jgi:hypothetical protein
MPDGFSRAWTKNSIGSHLITPALPQRPQVNTDQSQHHGYRVFSERWWQAVVWVAIGFPDIPMTCMNIRNGNDLSTHAEARA